MAIAEIDFETYSEAGLEWTGEKWVPMMGATRGGLFACGAAAYAEHPSAEVICLYYDLRDGIGERLWIPGMPNPQDLFDHLAAGRLVEAWNVGFEAHIWREVCQKLYGWPELPLHLCRDAMDKARAWALPGALGKAAEVLGTDIQKDKDGQRLIKKFPVPRKPTKKNPALRIRPIDDPEDAQKFYDYCRLDILSERAVSESCPDLDPMEEQFRHLTLVSNQRGVGLDYEGAKACANILNQVYAKYDAELCALTGGTVPNASKVAQIMAWLETQGVNAPNLDDAMIETLLAGPELPPVPRRVLEIRQRTGSAGVKKVYAMLRQVARGSRLCDLFKYHGARTGRDTGADVQPQNLVKAGPKLNWCENSPCGKPYDQSLPTCPHCGTSEAFSRKSEWDWSAVDQVLEDAKRGDLAYFEQRWPNPVLAISGCIRGMFVAAEGHELIASDYSSIEAVVTAMLAGEQWRIDAFHQKQDIYLVSAGRITGTTLEQYEAYKQEHGSKHPDRQKLGKPAELGLGFGGWIAAWYQFDKSGTFTEDEVKKNIVAWREASPAIVELWGGQVRGKPWRPDRFELYGLEGAAISAVQNPGRAFSYRLITYAVYGDVLYARLPSGRCLSYHKPRLTNTGRWEGTLELSFEGWNSNPKMGPIGWHRINTYGGRLTENVVQAVARDIMRDAVIRLEAAGFPIVLRVHDELVAEVPIGTRTVEEFEALMMVMPDWAKGWPVRAAGGWAGKRYRKD